MRSIALALALGLCVTASGQDCNSGTSSCAGSGMNIVANEVPGGGIIVTPGTELVVTGLVYVCEPIDENEQVCGALDSFVNITLPNGQTVEHALGALCPGDTAFVEQTWTVVQPDLPVLEVGVAAGGHMACGEWETSYVTEFMVLTSAYADECPGDKDGDGDADADDLVAVVDWMDVLGIDALVEVILNWGCEVTQLPQDG